MRHKEEILAVSLIAAGWFLFTLVYTVPAQAQVISKNLGVTVYPSKGQSGDTQAKDETQCYTWAQKQTGIADPSSPPAQQQKTGPDGSRVKGAARGAARGAVIGEIANDDAGKGGAIGAAAGAVRGKQQSRKAGGPAAERCGCGAETDIQQGLLRLHGGKGIFREIMIVRSEELKDHLQRSVASPYSSLLTVF